MNHAMSPSAEDIEALAGSCLEGMPEELLEYCESLAISVEEWPDETMQQDQDSSDPFEILASYKSGKEIAPGIEKKSANDDDALILYRRPILDIWCETGEDLSVLIRNVMIEELGRHFDFSEDEIEELSGRHHQGML